MVDYESMERWIESQLDTGFIHEGVSYNWKNLNRDIEEGAGRPDKAKETLKETILALYEREAKSASDAGLDIAHLEGLREYGERKLIVDTKREKSWERLFEDNLEWINPAGEEFGGWNVIREFERLKGIEVEEREAIAKEKSVEFQLRREEQRLKDESMILFPEFLQRLETARTDTTLSPEEIGKELTKIRQEATITKALDPENIRRIVQIESAIKIELGLIGAGGPHREIVRKAETPLRQDLVRIQRGLDNLYLTDDEKERKEHVDIVDPETGKLNLRIVTRKYLKAEGIFRAEMDDAIRIYHKDRLKIQKEALKEYEEPVVTITEPGRLGPTVIVPTKVPRATGRGLRQETPEGERFMPAGFEEAEGEGEEERRDIRDIIREEEGEGET